MYKRVLLKLSGESLMGSQPFGIVPEMLEHYSNEIHEILNLGTEVAVVIGGGNIFRGLNTENSPIHRVQGDHMGMLATVINALALQSVLEENGMSTRVMTALEMNQIAEPYIRRRAIRHLEKKRVVIFAAGTGSPYFTTDSAAALRASEIEADIILKGTRVDGIYSSDPEKNESATKYAQLSFQKVIERKLKIMDMTAFTLCEENNIPISVFNIHKKGNLKKLLTGESIGTLVSDE